MSDISLNGGSDADRDEILQLHHDYLDANTSFDADAIPALFSGAPDATFFNLNGFTYNGRAHWIRLWHYYAGQVRSTFWTPYDLGGFVGAETAVVWCHRRCRRNWVGADTPVKELEYGGAEFMSRSTLAFRKEDPGWRIVHAHFSKGEEGERPGGV